MAVVLSDEVKAPVTLIGSNSFCHVRVNDLYVCAVTNHNSVRKGAMFEDEI